MSESTAQNSTLTGNLTPQTPTPAPQQESVHRPPNAPQRVGRVGHGYAMDPNVLDVNRVHDFLAADDDDEVLDPNVLNAVDRIIDFNAADDGGLVVLHTVHPPLNDNDEHPVLNSASLNSVDADTQSVSQPMDIDSE